MARAKDRARKRRVRFATAKADKAAPRYPCGKRRPDEARKAREARSRVFGLAPEHASHALAGTAYGRLALRGALHPDQPSARQMCNVCDRVWSSWRAYQRAMDLRDIRAAGLEPRIRGEQDEPDDEQDAAAIRAWRDIEGRLREHPLAWRALWRLVIEDREIDGYELVNARLAINSLARMWKIVDGRGGGG